MKKFVIACAAMLAGLTFSAPSMAADTIKGLNQSGVQETVALEPIFAVKADNGKILYRSSFGGGTQYSLTDASGTNMTKALASFGTGNALQAYDGWIYNLKKLKVICYNPQTTAITIAGLANLDYLPDNCAFATAAYQQ